MSGTRAGGLKAAATNKSKHGEDFYSRIGKIGGENGHTGGFASNPWLAKIAGAKGGKISRRTLDRNKVESLETRRRKVESDEFDRIISQIRADLKEQERLA